MKALETECFARLREHLRGWKAQCAKLFRTEQDTTPALYAPTAHPLDHVALLRELGRVISSTAVPGLPNKEFVVARQ